MPDAAREPEPLAERGAEMWEVAQLPPSPSPSPPRGEEPQDLRPEPEREHQRQSGEPFGFYNDRGFFVNVPLTPGELTPNPPWWDDLSIIDPDADPGFNTQTGERTTLCSSPSRDD